MSEEITDNLYLTFRIFLLLMFLSELHELIYIPGLIRIAAGIIQIYAVFLLVKSLWKWVKRKIMNKRQEKVIYGNTNVSASPIQRLNQKKWYKVLKVIYIPIFIFIVMLIGQGFNLLMPNGDAVNWSWFYATLSLTVFVDFIIRRVFYNIIFGADLNS